MNKKEALELILIKRNYKDKNTSIDKLLNIISKKKYSLRELGFSNAGVAGFTRRNFPDKPRTNIKLCTFLLLSENIKCCSKCEKVLDTWLFSKNKSNIQGLNGWCKECQNGHQKENPEMWRNYAAIRRLRISKAKPVWEKQTNLLRFYKECPKGYEVDHIIPIVNGKVSGLHCVDNLQYLTRLENQIKHNKFKI